MPRKTIIIALFVCLIAAISPIARAANFWDYQLEWKGGTDRDWHNPANWTPEPGLGVPAFDVSPNGPDVNNRVVIQPNQPGPIITSDANSLILGLDSWDPTSWGGQDANLTIGPGAADVNFGFGIYLAAETDFDSKLGGTTLVSRAIINQYDGTARTVVTKGSLSTDPDRMIIGTGTYGLNIGGGSSNFADAYGVYNLYGGLAIFPRIRLFFGEINIYGGTMEATDGNFVFAQFHPENKINVNGGTLIVDGNWMTSDPCTSFTAFIKNGRIVCTRGGALGAPYFVNVKCPGSPPEEPNVGYTTISGTCDFNMAWNPIPEMNATNVHYRANDVNTGITLTWNRGEPNVWKHEIYFGTSSTALVLQATYTDANQGDPCSYTVPAGFNFKMNTVYYWRIDETARTSDSPVPVDKLTTGQVWKFTTHDGKAYNPFPALGTTALKEPLQLSWTPSEFAGSTNGHRIYLSTAATDFNPVAPRPTDKRYRGQQTGTTYSIASLSPDWTLAPGTTYYWVIDEVNTLSGSTVVTKGNTWSFTPADYVNIDDFEDYNNFADMNAAWQTVYDNNCSRQNNLSPGGLSLISNGTGKYMRFTYLNSNPDGSRNIFWSEARKPYAGGTTFTGGGALSTALAAIRVDYLGDPTNGADPDWDRMYMALEDTAGHVGIVQNPNPNASNAVSWTTWYVGLNDSNFAGVNKQSVSSFDLGFGVRCTTALPPGVFGGDGNVMFDNLRLYGQTCNPAYAKTNGLSADLDGDCDVDVNDLDAFANDWLWKAVPEHTITTTVPHKAPVLWYKFNETTGNVAADSGPGAYDADVCNVGDVAWDPAGGRNGAGCINLNTLTSSNTHVEIPTAAFAFMADADHYFNTGDGGSVSFSIWTNADPNIGDLMTNSWASLITAYSMDSSNNYLELMTFSIPFSWGNPHAWFSQSPVGGVTATAYSSLMPINYFGGQWNHWAAVKTSPDTLTVYCNGSVVVTTSSADVAAAPLFKLPLQSFRLGMRGQQWNNWGKWTGEIQDFMVFDYALDANEVGCLATDCTSSGTGTISLMPLVTPANLKNSGDPATEIVDLKDLAVIGQQWHQQKLWP